MKKYLNIDLPDQIVLVNPIKHFTNILDKIFSCCSIIYSSLHGLICESVHKKTYFLLNEKNDYGTFKFL